MPLSVDAESHRCERGSDSHECASVPSNPGRVAQAADWHSQAAHDAEVHWTTVLRMRSTGNRQPHARIQMMVALVRERIMSTSGCLLRVHERSRVLARTRMNRRPPSSHSRHRSYCADRAGLARRSYVSIRERVNTLVREVEAGRFVEAIDANYADDASSHEPTASSRRASPRCSRRSATFSRPSRSGTRSKLSMCSSMARWRQFIGGSSSRAQGSASSWKRSRCSAGEATVDGAATVRRRCGDANRTRVVFHLSTG